MNLSEFTEQYISRINTLLGRLEINEIESFFDQIKQTTLEEGRVYLIGNGGSAATCSHFANDFSRCEIQGKPIRAISLCENNSLISAIANDFGYENIFKLQLKRELRKEDLVVAVSVSGNSENLVNAIEYSNTLGVRTFGFLGSDGGKLLNMVTSRVHIKSGPDEFGPVEDIHLILNHLYSNYIRRNFT